MNVVKANVVKGFVIIGLATLGMLDAFRLSHRMKAGSGLHEVVGPDLYLKVISAVMMVCGLLLLSLALAAKKGPAGKRRSREIGSTAHVSWIAAAYIMYVLAAIVLGYFLGSVLFFAAIFYLFGFRPWFKVALLGLGVAAVSYYFFVHLMGVELPKGWIALPF
jgi:hypothetical protein